MRRKFESIFSLISLLIFGLALGLVHARMVYQLSQIYPTDGPLQKLMVYVILPLLILVIVFLFHIFFHEFGHMVFGLISGYRLLYFRIASHCLVTTPAGLKIRYLKIPGTGGQCIMVPPTRTQGSYPFVLYNLGGGLANFFLALMSYLIFVNLKSGPILSSVLLFSVLSGLYLGIINLVPLESLPNDGANILSLKNKESNRRALYQVLKREEKRVLGEEFQIEKLAINKENLTSIFRQGQLIDQMEELMVEGDFFEAMELGEALLKEKINIIYSNNILTNLEAIYSLFDDREKLEIVDSRKDYQRYRRNSYVVNLERTKYLRATLTKEQSGREYLNRLNELSKNFIYPSYVDSNMKIINYGDLLKKERDRTKEFQLVDSTNDLAKSFLKKGDFPIIMADQQDKGRGQAGKSFFSPQGGFYMSYSLKPSYGKDQLKYLTGRAALAAKEAIRKTTGIEVSIKWINDLYYEDKKIGGILSESSLDNKGRLNYLLIGIGLNLMEDENPPEEIRTIYGSLGLRDYEKIKKRLYFLMVLELKKLENTPQVDGFLRDYNQALYRKNQTIKVRSNGKNYLGRLVEINKDMELVLDGESGRKSFSYNDTRIVG